MGRGLKRLALDSSAMIYLVEGAPAVRDRVVAHLSPYLRDRVGRLPTCATGVPRETAARSRRHVARKLRGALLCGAVLVHRAHAERHRASHRPSCLAWVQDPRRAPPRGSDRGECGCFPDRRRATGTMHGFSDARVPLRRRSAHEVGPVVRWGLRRAATPSRRVEANRRGRRAPRSRAAFA